MYQRRTLALSADERAALLHHRDHDPQPYVRERCAALLKIADGHAPYAVANAGLRKNRDPDTVYAWLDHYRDEGLPGLFAHQHGGNRRRCL
jgi:hypothetical protein